MKLLIVSLLFLSFESHAQKKLGPEQFQSSIRPVLSGILSDFYQMISLFPDFPRELITIIDELDGIESEKASLLEKCPKRLEKSCLENINRLRGKFLSIQAKSFKLIANQKMNSNLHMNPLGGIRSTNEFQFKLESIKGELDNASLIISAGANQKKETYQLIKKMDELSTYASLTVVEYVPFSYQADFRHFYFNFIHPLQLHISQYKNHEFLYRNIDSLNFAINLINQNLTKRNKKTPEGMAPFLALMHNRWNSILRYYY
jgi:hypothetical protein